MTQTGFAREVKPESQLEVRWASRWTVGKANPCGTCPSSHSSSSFVLLMFFLTPCFNCFEYLAPWSKAEPIQFTALGLRTSEAWTRSYGCSLFVKGSDRGRSLATIIFNFNYPTSRRYLPEPTRVALSCLGTKSAGGGHQLERLTVCASGMNERSANTWLTHDPSVCESCECWLYQ